MNAARSTTSRSRRPLGRRLLLLVAVLCTGNPATGSEPPIADRLRDIETQVVDVVERTMPSVVRVTTAGRVGTSATGVVFDRSGLVLTAGHVVDGDPRRLSIELPDGRRFRARVVSSVFDGDVGGGGGGAGAVEDDTSGEHGAGHAKGLSSHHGIDGGRSVDGLPGNSGGRFSRKLITPSATSTPFPSSSIMRLSILWASIG